MINRQRVFLPSFILMLCFTVVAARLFYIQVWHHADLKQRVDKLIFRNRPELPCRGMILDREGRVLCMSRKTYTLFADPKMIDEPRAVETQLAKAGLKVPRNAIASARNTSFLPLVKELDMDTVQKIRGMKMPGLGFTSSYDRCYPEGRMASHLLGVVGRDGAGLEGIELSYNSYLTGEKIQQQRMRDGRGREITEKLVNPEDARGADVYLTIDKNLQFIAEQEIEKAWSEAHAKKGMAIIQDCTTGEILAMASRPSFDPGNFAGARSLKNPVVSDIYEPGSTFKLVTAAAALQEKVVRPKEYIWCENGQYKLFNHTIKDHEKKGSITFTQVIEYSSNIGTAKVGQRLGKDRLYQYIRQFGFFGYTGIDVPGEARGLLKDPKQWSGLSLPIISFGQEVGVTAIQVINAYTAMVNGGMLMEPRVIREIRNPAGGVLYKAEPRMIRQVVPPEISAQLRNMLTGVVERGTGLTAKVPGYSVGGKTGTAQKRDPVTGRYSTANYVASFCGAIPMSRPKLTIYVVLDEPQGDYYGASRACPVFSRIASRAMQYLQIPPDQSPVNVCASAGNYAAAPVPAEKKPAGLAYAR